MPIRIYLDESTTPFQEIENAQSFEFDSSGISDGTHTLRVETVENGHVTGRRSLKFSVRNGPGIAIVGLSPGDEIRGTVQMLVNASDGTINNRYTVQTMETHRGFSFWMGAFCVLVIAACALYLATDPFRFRMYSALAEETAASARNDLLTASPAFAAALPNGRNLAVGTPKTAPALKLVKGEFLPLTTTGSLIGDAVKGRSIFSARCSGCHGAEGEGTLQEKVTLGASGIYPRLAGQNQIYILRQLNSFAGNWRDNAQMQPMAASLSPKDRLDVATYIETLAPGYTARDEVSADLVAQGHRIAQIGLADQGVTRCSACHGASGTGAGANFPWLAGQNADYLAQQLRNWRDGHRRNSWRGLMRPVAQGLTEGQINAVAAYYSQLRPAHNNTHSEQGR